MKVQGRAGVIPLKGEMFAKQTKGCLNSENLPPPFGARFRRKSTPVDFDILSRNASSVVPYGDFDTIWIIDS